MNFKCILHIGCSVIDRFREELKNNFKFYTHSIQEKKKHYIGVYKNTLKIALPSVYYKLGICKRLKNLKSHKLVS